MTDRLTEAVEKCRDAMLPNVPPQDRDKAWHKGMVMGVEQDITAITPVLRELCKEIERYKERHDGLWETIREFSAKDMQQREEIDRLTQPRKPWPTRKEFLRKEAEHHPGVDAFKDTWDAGTMWAYDRLTQHAATLPPFPVDEKEVEQVIRETYPVITEEQIRLYIRTAYRTIRTLYEAKREEEE